MNCLKLEKVIRTYDTHQVPDLVHVLREPSPNFDPRRAILEAFGTSSGSRRMISRLLNLDSRNYNFSVMCHANGGLGVAELFEEIKQDDMLSRLTNNRKGTMLTIFIFL